jgi:hypothetical protein
MGGYAEAPWTFTGRALYQLQLVRSEEARKFVPPGFSLVELFGHTLGGFYLARYDDSPVGAFDELVLLSGLVWNAPTSCAWASRVYVSNRAARDHGRAHVGLPSRVADFLPLPTVEGGQKQPRGGGNWWAPARRDGSAGAASTSAAAAPPAPAAVRVLNVDPSCRPSRGLQLPVCTLPIGGVPTWLPGPRLTLWLPSFSGGTPEHPGLLMYSCRLLTNVALLRPLRLGLPGAEAAAAAASAGEAQMDAVLGGAPLLALAFSDMHMSVGAPTPLTLAAAAAPLASSK